MNVFLKKVKINSKRRRERNRDREEDRETLPNAFALLPLGKRNPTQKTPGTIFLALFCLSGTLFHNVSVKITTSSCYVK